MPLRVSAFMSTRPIGRFGGCNGDAMLNVKQETITELAQRH
jgi:hypothetical protein